ncbi:MAG: hypothetical protein ACYS3S_26585, partial [Planctomycetota bacterium]
MDKTVMQTLGTLLFLMGVLLAAVIASGAEAASVGEPLVINGYFEEGEAGQPEGWTHKDDDRAVFKWESSGGIYDSRCLSITIDREATDAYWSQKLKLEPLTAYILRGRIKGENIEIKQEGGRIGANICRTGIWHCSSDPKKSVGTFPWQRFEVDFCSDESGELKIACRLGHW